MGKFCQIFIELSAHDMIMAGYYSFRCLFVCQSKANLYFETKGLLTRTYIGNLPIF